MSENATIEFNPFISALEVMDRRGWGQGIRRPDPASSVCLLEAISEALRERDVDDDVDVEALLVVADQFDGCVTAAVTFNDDPLTSEEDVRLQLKRMAETWEARSK